MKPYNDAIEPIAKVCHEVNRAYCMALGDDSHAAWESSPEELKNSTRSGISFCIENTNSTPEQIHQNWVKEKIQAGWVYGAVKDAQLKTHPCIVPYSELPERDRVKDSLFRAVVKAMAPENNLLAYLMND